MGTYYSCIKSERKPKTMGIRDRVILMIGYDLGHSSGSYWLYDPNIDSIIESNSIKYSEIKQWKAW